MNKHVHALAPGGDPSDKCTVEAAKANLVAPCTKYLLAEKMDDGLSRLPWAVPDFSRVRAVEDILNAAVPLTDVKQARLDKYLKDKAMMARLREIAAADLELYNFALKNYDKQWESRVEPC